MASTQMRASEQAPDGAGGSGGRQRPRTGPQRWGALRPPRHWRVRSKLIAALAIPTVAFLALASFSIGASLRDAAAFADGNRLAGLGRGAATLIHELQAERDLTAGYIASGQRDDLRLALTAQQQRANQAVQSYRAVEAPLYGALGPAVKGALDTARAELDRLTTLRVMARLGAATGPAIFDGYSRIVGALLAVESGAGREAGDEQLAQRIRALANLARTKEAAAQVRGRLYAIAYQGRFSFGEAEELVSLIARRQAALDRYLAEASSPQRALYAETVRGQAVLAVVRIQQVAIRRQLSGSLGIDPEQWRAASTTEIELLRTVERQLIEAVVAQSRDLSLSARRAAAATMLVIALILTGALAASLLVAQSIAQPLQRLRASALEVASGHLPAAVQQLETGGRGDLEAAVEPLPIDAEDEIGELARAFDEVHRQAVRLAGEQAALRRSVSEMFVHLARRNQALIDRQLELLDEFEREELDPGQLRKLFQLDHLATRIRRNGDNLVVLSGEESPQLWSEPLPLVDVVRAAISEVEAYTRVEFTVADEPSIVGRAVDDLAHLLAELIENATSFSPPDTKVRVDGERLSTGYLIEIADQGLGMPPEELARLNRLLEDPPLLGSSFSRLLGIRVVGQLAARHGIRVQLRSAHHKGTVALVLVPDSLIEWPAGTHLPPVTRRSRPADVRLVTAPARRPAAWESLTAGPGSGGQEAEGAGGMLERFRAGAEHGRATANAQQDPPAPAGGRPALAPQERGT